MRDRWFHSSEADGYKHIGHVAIAVKQVSPGQFHTAILHRHELQGLSLLHLTWHYELRNEPPKESYIWVECALPSLRTRQVAAKCRLIWKRHKEEGLPYGLSYARGAFDPLNGKLLLDPGSSGLTCATFVLAIFQTCGIQLVQAETWPRRDDDEEWQRQVVEALRQRGAKQDHVAALCQEIGCFRFRPPEVAAASSLSAPPNDFYSVDVRAIELVAVFESTTSTAE